MAVATPIILSDGKPVEGKYELHYLEVSNEVNRIPCATLKILDGNPARGGFQAGASTDFALGQPIEIVMRIERSRQQSGRPLFKGIVTSQAIEADKDNTILTVELKHSAFRLTRGRKNRIFGGASPVTDLEIFRSVLQGYKGLKLSAKAAKPQPEVEHEKMVQYHATDWDFLMMRAEAIGRLAVVEKDNINLLEIGPESSKVLKLQYGIDDIYELQMEADSEEQFETIRAVSWDSGKGMPKEKTVTQRPSTQQDTRMYDGTGARVEILQNGGSPKQENQSWAEAVLAKRHAARLRGRIQLPGRSDISLGQTLELEGFGGYYDGKAQVTGIKHTLSINGWDTDLQLGLSDRWFHQKEDIMAPPAGGLLPGIHGLHIGTVETYEKDPQDQYRVKVKLPLPYPAENEKDGYIWARLASFYAGAGHGAFFFPEPGDEVVVGFLNDDPRHAVILGSLYSKKQPPTNPFNVLHDKNQNTKKGIIINHKDPQKALRIIFHDEEGSYSIQIQDGHGNEIVLNQEGITLTGNTIDFQ